MMLLNPLEDLDPPLLQPQLVADKSLIVLFPPKVYLWFIICAMACMCFPKMKKFFAAVQFLAVMG